LGVEYRPTQTDLRRFGLIEQPVRRRIAAVDECLAADGRIGTLGLSSETDQYRYAEPPGHAGDFTILPVQRRRLSPNNRMPL
jgi:hypothetical protein